MAICKSASLKVQGAHLLEFQKAHATKQTKFQDLVIL